MTQIATVTALPGPGTAEVTVARQPACGHDCESCAGCGTRSAKVVIRASTAIPVAVGDRVEVYSSGRVLGVAALVYLGPVALFLLGYLLPLLPMAVGQSVICLGAAVALGLPLSWNLPAAVAALIPSALLFIALGLLCGTLFNDKQVGGMCGALLTNVTAFLAGIWFDLSLMGGEFKSFAYLLPFAHGADAAKAALAGEWAALPGHLLWVSAWAAALMALAVWLFRRKLTEQ